MAVDVTSLDPVVAARRADQRARTDALRAEYRHELNVAYGDHPGQVLDIYQPRATATAAPVLVFLHGGGFRRGAPGVNAYHGAPYLERGSVFVSMGYRLVPDLRFPDTVEDVERGLQWLVDHLAERGGDATRIFLSGHSAGATLAAATGLRATRPDVVKGLVLISGMYDFTRHSDETINRDSARYVPELWEAIERIPEAHTVIVGGDHDMPAVLPDAEALLAAIQARGGSAEMFVEPNADHFQANRGFITPDGAVAQAVSRMMSL